MKQWPHKNKKAPTDAQTPIGANFKTMHKDMKEENLTPDQLRRLARGMHNRAAQHEENAADFPRSAKGEMKLAEMCRAEAHKYEQQAESEK